MRLKLSPFFTVCFTFSVTIIAVLSSIRACQAQPPAQPSLNVYAIVGARIEVGDGSVITKGTVLIRDGLIEAVGAGVVVPPEAEILSGDGLTVYPGFIDAHATRGLNAPELQPNQDIPPDRSAMAAPFMREANRKGVRPELQADRFLELTDDILKPARQAGFTTELLMPSGGTINGSGALVNLSGAPRRDCVLRASVAMGFTFSTTGAGYPNSLMGIMALTRQTLLDARYYHELETAFAHGGSRRPPDDPTLAALQEVLTAKLPVLYDADAEKEVRRALALGDEFGLKVMLSGGAEAWKVAPLLAQRKIPVLLSLNFGPEPGVTPQPGASAPNSGAAGGQRRPRRGAPDATGDANKAAPPVGKGAAPPVAPALDEPINQAPVLNLSNLNDPKQNDPKQVDPKADRKPETPGAPPAAPDEESEIPEAARKERHKKWEEKVANAAMLSKAGVSFALTTQGARTPAEFFTNLRRAIKAGLPRDVALRALTIDAARIFGVERQLGTVQPGKIAALVVMTGDFAEANTKVKYAFIDKNKFEPDRDLGPVPTLPRRRIPAGDDDDDLR